MRELGAQPSIEPEWQVSTNSVVAGLATAGIGLALSAKFAIAGAAEETVALLLITLAGSAWLLSRRSGVAARWVIAVGTLALVLSGTRWMASPVSIILVPLPPLVALMTVGDAAGIVMALAESLLFAPLVRRIGLSADPFTLGMALVAIWATFALVISAHHRLRDLLGWLSSYYAMCRDALSVARDDKAEADQLREDWANASRQLMLANERLAGLRRAAEDERTSKAAFVANVSHEFRTPLNIIIGMVELLVEAPEVYGGPLPARAVEHLRTVYDNCQHLASMIDDVLDLSRAEAGRMRLHREYVDLSGVIEGALSVVRPLIDEKALSLRVDVPDNLPQVYCDPTRIRQVLLNLLSNAARLTRQGGVSVGVERRESVLTVAINDTGPGIAPDEAEGIFAPFGGGPGRPRGNAGGSGLGLSISKELIHLHGGRIWVESELGRGSTFFVELPLHGPVTHVARPERWIRSDWIWRERAFRTVSAGLGEIGTKLRVVVCDQTGGLAPELTHFPEDVDLVETRDLAESIRELQRCPAHFLVINAASESLVLSLIDEAGREVLDTPVVGCCYPVAAPPAARAGTLEYLTKPVLRADLSAVIGAAGRHIRRVLIVDDEADARELLVSYMRVHDPTIEVLEAESGPEALRALRDWRPDLMLLDLVMPGVDGWQVLGAKRDDDGIRDIPTVLVSAHDMREEPARSGVLMSWLGWGISGSKLLRWCCETTELLRQSD